MKTGMASLIIIFVIFLSFAGCSKIGDDISLVKNGILFFDKSLTVGQAVDGYKYFKTRTWEKFTADNGRKVVQFTGTIDMDNSEIKTKYAERYAENRVEQSNYQRSEKEMVNYLRFSSEKVIIQFLINVDNTFENNAISAIGTKEDGTTQETRMSIGDIYNNKVPDVGYYH